MSEKKFCAKCETWKTVDDFYWKVRSRNLRQSHCIPCKKEYGREHYEQNKNYYLARSAERKKGRRPQQTWNYQGIKRGRA